MLKKILLITVIFFCAGISTYAQETTVDGYGYYDLNVLNFDQMPAPSVSASSQSRLYFDDIELRTKISEDGSSYLNIIQNASEVDITDSGGYYTGTEVETALQEIGAGTTLDSRYFNLDQDAAGHETITGTFAIANGFYLDGDINTSHLTDSLFFDEDGTLFYITNQGLGGGKSAFITVKRNDSTGSSGFALGEVGQTDSWDVMMTSGGTDLAWYNIAGGQVKSLYLESGTGHLGLGTASPSARIHAIDTTLQQRLEYDATHYTDIHTDSSGYLTLAPTGGLLTASSMGANLTLPGATTRASNSNFKIEGYSRTGSQTALFNINQLNSDGNWWLANFSVAGTSKFSLDNEGDMLVGQSIGMGGGTAIIDTGAPDSSSLNFVSAKNNGFLFHTYSTNPTVGRVRMGWGNYAQDDLTTNRDWDDLLIRRDADGASTYSEAGALLKLERDVTNVTAENGHYIEADAGFILKKDFELLIANKISFTQTDGNEYIDSLADGFMDYGATTAHRFLADVKLTADNRKLIWGTGDDFSTYYDGTNQYFNHGVGTGQTYFTTDVANTKHLVHVKGNNNYGGYIFEDTRTNAEAGVLMAGTTHCIFGFSNTGGFAIQADTLANILSSPGTGTTVFEIEPDGDTYVKGANSILWLRPIQGALGDIPAGSSIFTSNAKTNKNLSFFSDAALTTGAKVGIFARTSTSYLSVVEVANVASGNLALELLKSGGDLKIAGNTGQTGTYPVYNDGTSGNVTELVFTDGILTGVTLEP